MDPKKIDVDALLDRLSEEVARRFARGTPTRGPDGRPGSFGPPFCAVCTVHGTCAKTCPDPTQAVLDAGAARISTAPGMGALERKIAAAIDHTLLKPEATKDEVTLLCAEAVKYGFASVCVTPFWVPLCAKLLQGHPVMVCTVVGFPLGANRSETKAEEAARAVAEGAHEVDMVINVGALKSGMADVVEADIRAVREAAPNATLKVILETSLLNDHEKVAACEAAKRARADFVKTSTGFSTGGATAGDIALMRRVVGEDMGVKASGGVRTRKDATLMLASGATRIGASASVKIMSELPALGQKSGAEKAAGGGAY